ncbi:glycerophosphodiester phosphodiesterase family protein [Costertonia aggregata]|uniref:GP-PDE domain-containing protein n=1 Tax=Costertonia aggregata TaxID=343403 RepID=A0A7H9APA2_9FLAO|nr:glycerophosphodiester phosphodiesterase family protein [Costertonia aggregata]QLG45256.1 hypothetical protein HYG79_07815 [Costertonia aggregata]
MRYSSAVKIIFGFFLSFLTLQYADAHTPSLSSYLMDADGVVELKSNSFNAKKRSSFTVNGITEHIGRGLTIICFKPGKKYEFKTFDTYSSPEASQEFVTVLTEIKSDGAIYAILAHDSASKSLATFSQKLKKIGFPVLSGLQNRQAYIAHNIQGQLIEKIDGLSVTLDTEIPENVSVTKEYFPKIKYEFEPSNDRFIAHAGGEINGVKSTNSLQALNENYKKGFRFFELDIVETKDGKLVAAHDWKMWARFTDYKGELPPTLSEFKKHKIYGDYTTLDFKGINDWFAAHPDATLITDKVNDPIKFANNFVDKSRLVMELFSLMALEEASKNGVNAMISQEPLQKIKGDKLEYLNINNIKYVALSRRIIESNTKLLLQLRDNGIKVYVYNVNFDPGKDEAYVLENEIGLVYGMYADKWVFDSKNP